MVGSRAEKAQSSRVGKNWVTIGFWKEEPTHKPTDQPQTNRAGPTPCGDRQLFALTLRYSTGLVTLNLSMVEMMMAGVVRKKSRMKRMQLMMKQRIHQEIPPSDRCSLQERERGGQSVLLV